MGKRLKRFLNKLNVCKKSNVEAKTILELPQYIDDTERIVRSIFSPVNIHPKKGTVLANAFKPRANEDEVSVNRLNYTNADFCKKISKKIEQPLNKRLYFGLAVLAAEEIRSAKADVIYSPIYLPVENLNPFHSDIIIGYMPEQGKPMPGEFQEKVNNLAKKARLYEDANPSAINWEGDRLV